jgi:hypothetical protein
VAFDESKHPRWPKGTPGKAGRFMEIRNLLFAPGGIIRIYPEELREWADEGYGDWLGGLEASESDALEGYTKDRHRFINEALRNGEGVLPEQDDDLKAEIEALDAALDKSEVPGNVTVFRMMSDPTMLAAFESGDLEGATFVDYGYTSTTMTPEYLKTIADYSTSEPMQVTINVPKGTRGAYLGESSAEPDEHEMLLKRGTLFRVTSAKRGRMLNKEEGLKVRMEVVGQVDEPLRVESGSASPVGA